MLRNYSDTLTLEWMLGELGPVATFALVMAFGGTRVYVPESVDAPRRPLLLEAVVGQGGIQRLSEVWARDRPKVPLAKAYCANFLYWVEGASLEVTARRIRATTERVRLAIEPVPPACFVKLPLRRDPATRAVVERPPMDEETWWKLFGAAIPNPAPELQRPMMAYLGRFALEGREEAYGAIVYYARRHRMAEVVEFLRACSDVAGSEPVRMEHIRRAAFLRFDVGGYDEIGPPRRYPRHNGP